MSANPERLASEYADPRICRRLVKSTIASDGSYPPEADSKNPLEGGDTMTEKPKTKHLRGHGHINVSNVNSTKSQCITLTYSVKNVGSVEKAEALKKKLDKKSGKIDVASIEILGFETPEAETHMKWKIKSCDSEQKAHDIKKDCDELLRKEGGQTTLTEDFDDEEEEANDE